MLVLKLSTAGANNCAEVADTPYVYVNAEVGSFVLPARCPHRGGPLHLASVMPGTTRLVCPWHGRATSVAKAARRGVPAVRRGDQVTIVLPQPAGTAVSIQHRPLSTDLSGPRNLNRKADLEVVAAGGVVAETGDVQ